MARRSTLRVDVALRQDKTHRGTFVYAARLRLTVAGTVTTLTSDRYHATTGDARRDGHSLAAVMGATSVTDTYLYTELEAARDTAAGTSV